VAILEHVTISYVTTHYTVFSDYKWPSPGDLHKSVQNISTLSANLLEHKVHKFKENKILRRVRFNKSNWILTDRWAKVADSVLSRLSSRLTRC
jgi:hypothetical protein